MLPALCVVRSSMPICGCISEILFQQAAELYLREGGEAPADVDADIKTGICEGRVTMHPYSISLGSIAGPAFTAIVEFDSITTSVVFVIRRVELEILEEQRSLPGIWADATEQPNEPAFYPN